MGDWFGPRTGLERGGKPRPHRDSIPGQLVHNESLRKKFKGNVNKGGVAIVKNMT
jgi:hypothetical protein